MQNTIPINSIAQLVSEEINLKSFVEKIFFGNNPFPELSVFDGMDFQKIVSCLEAQKVTSFKDLNYILFIQDFAPALFPKLDAYYKDNKKIDRHTEIEKNKSGFMLRSIYLMLIQDANTSTVIKIEMGYLIVGLLTSMQFVFRCDLIDDMDSFVETIKKNEIEFINQRDIAINKAIDMAMIEHSNGTKIYSEVIELSELENQLVAKGFLFDLFAFIPFWIHPITMISTEDCYKNEKLNWQKSIISLVYLFHLIHDGNKIINGNNLHTFISKRFTVKGSSITVRQLSKANYTLTDKYIISKNTKPIDIELIDEIYSSMPFFVKGKKS